jgi:putative DNA primase/helicase
MIARTGGGASTSDPPIIDQLRAWGALNLDGDSPPDAVEAVLRSARDGLNGADPIRRLGVRSALVAELKRAGVQGPSKLVDAALAPNAPEAVERASRAVTLTDPEPWPDPVRGAELLDDLATWVGRYVWARREAIDAVVLWIALTWFSAVVYFAPILALLSATKRCGKTILLDLIRMTSRRGYGTSGIGATAAVIFRLNEAQRPTFCIDEAERLAGRNADQDLIGLLNNGYRRGGRVQRCEPGPDGGYEVVEFDAFGFRGLAAIGTLWDTIMDRSVVVPLQRRPTTEAVDRFNGRQVEREALVLAGRLSRWADDVGDAVAGAEAKSPRPTWLDDRACDNWSGLFAVAAVAGGDWPARAEAAARLLSTAGDAGQDPGERLVHDVRQIFAEAGNPEIMQSGDLARHLNELDSAPWADFRKGAGISTHKVAALFKPFGVHPRPSRDGSVRGYRLEDLELVFLRYPPPEVSECQKASNDKGNHPVANCQTPDTLESVDSHTATTVSDTLTVQEPDMDLFGNMEADHG